MAQILKWLLFVILCSAYVWAVFFWNNASADSNEHYENYSVPAEDLSSSSQEYQNAEEFIIDTIEYSAEDNVTENSIEDEHSDNLDESVNVVEPSVLAVSSATYSVISGSYLHSQEAEKALNSYKKSHALNGKVVFYDPYYKVVLAESNNYSEVKTELKKIREKGIDAFVQKNH